MTTISRANYVNIAGWMVTDLGLSGKELMAFAIVYGFCQDGSSDCSASRRYFADFLGCSMPTVTKTLKGLAERGLIENRPTVTNGVTTNHYRVSEAVHEAFLGGKEFTYPQVSNLPTPRKETFPYIKEEKVKIEVKEPPIAPQGGRGSSDANDTDESAEVTERVIGHLNETCHTAFRPTGRRTRQLVHARMAEGFAEDDLCRAIDNMAARWLDDERMRRFLRPETLFGATKFEGYLNAGPPGRQDAERFRQYDAGVTEFVPVGVGADADTA